MYDDVDPGRGMSTECGPAYHWNVVWSFGTSWVYWNRTVVHEERKVQRSERETRTENLVRMDGDDGPTVLPSERGRGISSMCGLNASKPADLVDDARERRRKRKIAATAMETTARPPTTPPAIAPAFELLLCVRGLGDGDPVEDALAEDVYTPDAPNIAPGPYSG